jgi:hypothetical protein
MSPNWLHKFQLTNGKLDDGHCCRYFKKLLRYFVMEFKRGHLILHPAHKMEEWVVSQLLGSLKHTSAI